MDIDSNSTTTTASTTVANQTKHAMNQDQRIIQRPNLFTSEPVPLVVELLVVADPSVYEAHRRYCRTRDKAKVFQHMRIYFSHLINGVNQRYQNSLRGDTEISISIKLTNFLFLTVKLFVFNRACWPTKLTIFKIIKTVFKKNFKNQNV